MYCTGCEQFYKIADLDEGRCPEHCTKPELIEEENWFFRLSRYEDALCELYARREIEVRVVEPAVPVDYEHVRRGARVAQELKRAIWAHVWGASDQRIWAGARAHEQIFKADA